MNTLLPWSLQPDFILGYWLNGINIKKTQDFSAGQHVLLQYSSIHIPFCLRCGLWLKPYWTVRDVLCCPVEVCFYEFQNQPE
jgi:hypothetical protein